MTERLCDVDGCDHKHLARGLCRKHYNDFWNSDDFKKVEPKNPPLSERIVNESEMRDGCRVWLGYTVPRGYGYVYEGGKLVYVHRWAYEQEHGPIPKGMVIDHICHNPSCVEVTHLRLATYSQNNAHKSGAMPGSATGVRNVHPHGPGYSVTIKKDKIKHRFGTYPTIEEAAKVAEKARAELFGAFAGRG